MSTYPNVATGDLTSSVIGSLFNRSRAASMLAAKSKKEAFKRFKSVGLTDKQAQDAVDHYNFGGAAFKSRFGGDRARRIRGFFGSKRPQDDITVTEKERVLRGMGLFTKKRKLNSQSEYSDSRDQESNFSNGGLPGGEENEDQSFSPMQGLLPPVGDNLEEALKGVGANGEYLTKEQRIEIFKKNRVARDVDSIFNKSSSTPPSSTTPSAIQKVETGNLIGSAIEKIFEDKNKELVEIIEDTADKVEDNSELLKKIERNTSFIEKLFELQKDAIEDAKVAAEEAEIDKTKDTAGFAGYKKSKFGGDGGLLSGIPGGGMLGNILDFGGDVLDVMGRRKRGRPGARRRLAKRKTNRFFGKQKNRLFGKQKNRLFGRKKRTPIKSRSAGEFVNGRYYKKKVSQFAPKKKNFLQKGLQKTKIAGSKLGKKIIGSSAKKAGAKAIAKGVGKGVGKSLLKKIPVLGLGVGALFAAQRAMAGDFVGAGLELASGAASTVPGLGTAASVGIDAALMAKDIHDESQMMDPGYDYGGEYETGGISEKPEIATLHGTEAIIPMSSMPLDTKKSEITNNISAFYGENNSGSDYGGEYETGGISEKPEIATLHGTEAIIPLPLDTQKSEVINNIAAVYGANDPEYMKKKKLEEFKKGLPPGKGFTGLYDMFGNPTNILKKVSIDGNSNVSSNVNIDGNSNQIANNNINQRSFNKNNIFEKNQQISNISNFFEKSKNSSGMLQAEMGAIADGPDTGYEVELHGTEAIIPLDNKFTRGEPTVTDGGEYERGNVNVEVEREGEGEREKKQTLAEKKKIQKDLAESFRMGLDIYQKKTPGGFLGELGQKIMNFLDNFGDNGDGDSGGRDAPEVSIPGGPGAGAGIKEGSDAATLATIAALESGSAQGQADVAQSVYNRLADGTYGDSITDILTKTGQYQVAFKDPTATSGAGTQVAEVFKNIKDEDSAVKAIQYYYENRGQSISEAEARKKFRDSVKAISDPKLQKAAAKHVGGRTEFRGYDTGRSEQVHRGSANDNYFVSQYGSRQQMARGAVAVPEGLFNKPESLADKSGDRSPQPNQQIVNNYGLEVGQEREFITSKGTRVKAHKTTKGFEFFNPGINQKIDFTNGQNSWIINDFIKSEGGLKPEKIQTAVNPPENGGPEPPSFNQASRSEQVKASSIAAAEANTSRIVAMAMPTAQSEVSAPSPSEPAASSSGLSSKPSDIAFSGLSYNINLHQLGATA